MCKFSYPPIQHRFSHAVELVVSRELIESGSSGL